MTTISSSLTTGEISNKPIDCCCPADETIVVDRPIIHGHNSGSGGWGRLH